MTFFPFSYRSLFFWIAAKTESRKHKYISKKVLKLSIQVLTQQQESNSTHLSILTEPLHVRRDANYRGEVVTGRKHKHGQAITAIQRRQKRRKEWILSLVFRQHACSLNRWPLCLLCKVFTPRYLMERDCEKGVDSNLPQTPLGVTLMQKSPSSPFCLSLQHLWAPQCRGWHGAGWRNPATLLTQLQEPLGQGPVHEGMMAQRKTGKRIP